jgi:hypothetical protein
MYVAFLATLKYNVLHNLRNAMCPHLLGLASALPPSPDPRATFLWCHLCRCCLVMLSVVVLRGRVKDRVSSIIPEIGDTRVVNSINLQYTRRWRSWLRSCEW